MLGYTSSSGKTIITTALAKLYWASYAMKGVRSKDDFNAGNWNADVADKAGQIETLNADVADKAGQIETLNADVADKAGQIETLNADVADKAGQIETLNADVADKASQIETLQADVAGKAEKIETLNAEITEKADRIEALNADVAGKSEQITALNSKAAEDEKELEGLRADNAAKDGQIKALSEEVQTKDKLIDTLKEQNDEKDKIIEGLQPSAMTDTEAPTEAPAESPKAEEEAGGARNALSALKMPKIGPLSVNGRITLNQQTMSMFGAMMAQGSESKLEKINSLIGFVNDLEYKVRFNGVDAEAFVSARGEDLASLKVHNSNDAVSAITDVIPSYFFTVSKADLAGTVSEIDLKADPQKLMEAVMQSLMKVAGGVRLSEPEQVNETILDTVFTSKITIDMTLKEVALLGLNACKEIIENEEVASVIGQLKAKGLDIPVEKIDQAIEQVSYMKDEDLPEADMSLYTNEKQDTVFCTVVKKDGQEITNTISGTIDGKGVYEYHMGDQLDISMKAGADGVFMTVKASGMVIAIHVVPRPCENGKAATATVTFSGMELLTVDIEVLQEAEITGTFDTTGRTELTIKDLKEKKTDLAKDLLEDAAANYKPVLMDKLQKVAPDMMSIFDSVVRLIKENAPELVSQIKLPK